MRGRAFARSRACSDSRIRRSSTGSEGSIGLSSREPRTKLNGRARAAVHSAGPCYPVRRSGQVAQLEEHGSEEPGVGGSIPSLATFLAEHSGRRRTPETSTTALARGRGLLTATSLGGSPPGTPVSTVPGGDTLEKAHHFGLTVAAVSAQGPDGAELACLRPTRDRLGIHAEEGSDLSWCEKRLARRLVPLHVLLLLSEAARRVRRAALCLYCSSISIEPVPLRRQWPVVTVFWPPTVSSPYV